MTIIKWTRQITKGFNSLAEIAAGIGYIIIAAIVLLVFVDVCGRYFLNKPLHGAYELVEQGMGVLAGFAIMYAAVKRGHIALDLIIGRFSRRIQTIMGIIFLLTGSGVSAVLAYRVYLSALVELKYRQVTGVLSILTAPFTFIFALALLLCSLTLLIQIVHPVASDENRAGSE